MINDFRGAYYFLSNFYESQVKYLGGTYKNNEAAFQAQKTYKPEERIQFENLNPSESKKLGRKIKLRPDLEELKTQFMYEICKAKFDQNINLKKKLISTGDEVLEEGNTWGDRIWGTVNGCGENRLGKILMYIRDTYRCEEDMECDCETCLIKTCVNCTLDGYMQ